jgi:CobQ/CobB/MinD/ParA nucleotide binding domain
MISRTDGSMTDTEASNFGLGAMALLQRADFQALIDVLAGRGYSILGPTVRNSTRCRAAAAGRPSPPLPRRAATTATAWASRRTAEGDQPEPSATTRRKDRATTSGSSASPASDDGSRRKVHVVLQGKGGVGKTYISSLIAQYLKDQGEPVACLDTDPVNASFAAIPALEAEAVDLLAGDRINIDTLDGMVERLLTEDENFIIDNGAASFVPLSRYLIENDITGLITAGGKGVVVHTVITGGPALLENVKALATKRTSRIGPVGNRDEDDRALC